MTQSLHNHLTKGKYPLTASARTGSRFLSSLVWMVVLQTTITYVSVWRYRYSIFRKPMLEIDVILGSNTWCSRKWHHNVIHRLPRIDVFTNCACSLQLYPGHFRTKMAPIGERNDTMGSVAADEDDSDSQNLWWGTCRHNLKSLIAFNN